MQRLVQVRGGGGKVGPLGADPHAEKLHGTLCDDAFVLGETRESIEEGLWREEGAVSEEQST